MFIFLTFLKFDLKKKIAAKAINRVLMIVIQCLLSLQKEKRSTPIKKNILINLSIREVSEEIIVPPHL